jgi:hypothetical protein
MSFVRRDLRQQRAIPFAVIDIASDSPSLFEK